MRDQDDGGVARVLDFEQQVQHGSLYRHIQRGDGFVTHDHGRVGGNGARDADALLFAAAQLARQAVVVAFIELDGAQQALHFGAHLIGRHGVETAQ